MATGIFTAVVIIVIIRAILFPVPKQIGLNAKVLIMFLLMLHQNKPLKRLWVAI